MSKIVKVIFDDGEELEYVEKPKENFTDEWSFRRQHVNFEKSILDEIDLDLEEWARNEYNLIDEDECEDCLLNDEELVDEAISRGLFKEYHAQNTNIYNQDFIDRFSVIIDRGDDVEIEKMLQLLEYRFKIG